MFKTIVSTAFTNLHFVLFLKTSYMLSTAEYCLLSYLT